MKTRLVVLALAVALGAAVLAGLTPSSEDLMVGDIGRCPAPLARL